MTLRRIGYDGKGWFKATVWSDMTKGGRAIGELFAGDVVIVIDEPPYAYVVCVTRVGLGWVNKDFVKPFA